MAVLESDRERLRDLLRSHLARWPYYPLFRRSEIFPDGAADGKRP